DAMKHHDTQRVAMAQPVVRAEYTAVIGHLPGDRLERTHRLYPLSPDQPRCRDVAPRHRSGELDLPANAAGSADARLAIGGRMHPHRRRIESAGMAADCEAEPYILI